MDDINSTVHSIVYQSETAKRWIQDNFSFRKNTLTHTHVGRKRVAHKVTEMFQIVIVNSILRFDINLV